MSRSPKRALALLLALLALAILLALASGATFGFDARVMSLRATRVVLACIVGAGLATTGTVLQAMTGNPLADPFVLGASSGAAVGVVAARWLGIGFSTVPLFMASAAGAFGAILLTLTIARAGRRAPVQTLVLSGVTVSTLGTAGVLVYYSLRPELATQAMNFLMGSLEEGDTRFLTACGTLVAAGIVVSLLAARALNAFAMGEETARHLGVDVEKLKIVFGLLTSALIGAIVAVSGLIGFVGLIVPHICRLLVGNDHRRLLPSCAIGGAAFLLIVDTIARTVVAPQQLSLGAITALCGGPFFLWLLHRRVHERDPFGSVPRDDRS